MKMNAGRCSQVAGRKKITTQLINCVLIMFFHLRMKKRIDRIFDTCERNGSTAA